MSGNDIGMPDLPLELSSNGNGLFECQGYFIRNVEETTSATCGQQHVASTSMNNGGVSSLSSCIPQVGGKFAIRVNNLGLPSEYRHIRSCCHSFQDSAMKRQARGKKLCRIIRPSYLAVFSAT
nr:hypothetical protein [Tanacetum cinerariifolium]